MIEPCKPIFSIIMPTYNRAPLLRCAIQCVLDQTYPNFELIIVDDASKDDTEECVKSFSDTRIQYIRQAANCGVSAARNAGILRSRGDFIIFLDDDDESYPDLLSATLNAFETETDTVGFGWSGIRRVQKSKDCEILLKERQWSRDIKYSKPLEYLGVGTGYGLTVLRNSFDTIGLFDESLRSCVDVDLLIRLGDSFGFTIVPGIHIKVYRHDGHQLTNVTEKRANALETVVRKNSKILQKHLTAWMRFHSRVAAMYYQVGNKRKGRAIVLRMLCKRPLEYRTWKSFLYHELVEPRRILTEQPDD